MPVPFRPAVLAAPVFVLLWSTGFIGGKFGLPYVEPMTFLAIRFALVSTALAAWVLLARAPWPSWSQAREAALVGALLHAVHIGGIFTALSLGTEAGTAAVIIGLHPVLTALIARQALGEHLFPGQWAGIGIGVLGVILVVTRKLEAGVGDLRGVALCLMSLAAISAASVRQKAHGGGIPLRSGTLIQFLAATAVVTPLAFAFESRAVEWSGELIFAMAWLVLVLSLGAVSLLLFLIRRGAASSVASLFFLVPPTTALIAWGLFGEVLGPVEIAGVGVTALGVVMVNRPELFRLRL